MAPQQQPVTAWRSEAEGGYLRTTQRESFRNLIDGVRQTRLVRASLARSHRPQRIWTLGHWEALRDRVANGETVTFRGRLGWMSTCSREEQLARLTYMVDRAQ